MSDSKMTDAERLIAHTETLDQANKIRNYLLKHRPIPGVFVYQVNWKDESDGFDVKVATAFGGTISDSFFQNLQNHLYEKRFEGAVFA